MNYRPEIDGLRAIAVVPVILFHAYPALVPGGFLGVDVFFVISGFLIAGILVDDLESGTFSLAKFYERRVRRILPALLVMVACSLVVAWTVMLPRAFGITAESAAAAAAFVSNVFFWQTTNYFDIDALSQPLLHTWSLSVEEQFYILFPLILAISWKRASVRTICALLLMMLLASLALSEWGSQTHAKVNYYFTPSRFWELLLGGLGAFVVRYRKPQPSVTWSTLGLLAVVGSIAFISPTSRHPSLITLIPTVGTLMMLVWGTQVTPVGRALSFIPLIGIGKISYSLYLWHFPVFSFAAALGPIAAEPWHIVLQIVLIFAIGTISWRYVETPFRHRRSGQKPGVALWGAAVAIAATIIVGQTLATNPNLTLRYLVAQTDERAMLTFAETYQPRTTGPNYCFFEKGNFEDHIGKCLPAGKPSIVLWGDSHAAALALGFEARFDATGLFSGPGCAPILDDGGRLSEWCASQNLAALSEMKANPPATLVLHAYWRNKRDQIRLLPETIAALRSALPDTQLVLMGGVPYWIPSLPERIVAEGVLGQFDAQIPAQLEAVIEADDRIEALLEAEITSKDVTFIRPTEILCRGNLCRAYAGKAPFAFDYGHLTDAGAAEFVTILQAKYPEAIGGIGAKNRDTN
jgi:peptidoglycan/LPS O-acetylase OafA/YrhL